MSVQLESTPIEATHQLDDQLAATLLENDSDVDNNQEKMSKSKKRRNKKKAQQDTTTDPTSSSSSSLNKTFSIPKQDNSVFRKVGDWKANSDSVQSQPPTVLVTRSPEGQTMEYNNHSRSLKGRESTNQPPLTDDDLANIRKAAEVHRNVRKFAQSYMRPGISMIDLCQRLEAKTLELVNAKGLECGWGFPTGCSINHVAAHYSPNHGDKTILQKADICKLDFGVHVGGRIVDCAFSVAFDPKFDSLIQATQDGTNVGIRMAGIDARFGDVSEAIQEAIESYEFDSGNGKLIPIRAIRNLNGHTMDPYRIHAGKSLPIVKGADCEDERMEEGEIYAIETFASTGKAYVVEDMECSHYMKDFELHQLYNTPKQTAPYTSLPGRMVPTQMPRLAAGPRALLQHIDQHFGTLPFCRRWLDDQGQQRHLMSLKALVDAGIVEAYPPLCDIKGSFTSQMEHTVILRPTCKEVVSRGEDF